MRHTCSGNTYEKWSSQLAEDVELHKTQSLHVFVVFQSSNFQFSFSHFICKRCLHFIAQFTNISPKPDKGPVVTTLAVPCYLLAIVGSLHRSSCYHFCGYFHTTRHEKHRKNITNLSSDSQHLWPFYDLFFQMQVSHFGAAVSMPRVTDDTPMACSTRPTPQGRHMF